MQSTKVCFFVYKKKMSPLFVVIEIEISEDFFEDFLKSKLRPF